MFEKEAEEYVRKIRHDVINWDGTEKIIKERVPIMEHKNIKKAY